MSDTSQGYRVVGIILSVFAIQEMYTVLAQDLPAVYILFTFFKLSCFFEVWCHPYHILWFIFGRGLFSRDGKSYALTVDILQQKN